MMIDMDLRNLIVETKTLIRYRFLTPTFLGKQIYENWVSLFNNLNILNMYKIEETAPLNVVSLAAQKYH